MKISRCKMDITGCFGMENPGHELLINLNQGGLIIPSLNPVNYVWCICCIESNRKYFY